MFLLFSISFFSVYNQKWLERMAIIAFDGEYLKVKVYQALQLFGPNVKENLFISKPEIEGQHPHFIFRSSLKLTL